MTAAAEPAAGTIVVLAATAVEARPLRRRLRGRPGVTVIRTGVGGAPAAGGAGMLVSCGLAGGLDPALPSGTVVIPDTISTASGQLFRCDPALVQRLRGAARLQGVEPNRGPLLTLDHIVSGAERATWAARGYAAVDMESALVGDLAGSCAAVRVVLDTAQHELSAAWARPGRALLRPSLWGEALWLGRTAPRLCDLVAAIVVAAL